MSDHAPATPPVDQTLARIDRERALGCLLGVAVGDALGTTLEFSAAPARPFSPLLQGPHRDVTGGGPFNVAPGQVTDDTQQACALFSSLWQARHYDVRDAANRYRQWQAHAFDIGNQTSGALARMAAGGHPVAAGRDTWEASGRHAAGNGSLMRCAPIGVLLAANGELRRRASVDDSAVTHFDPRCQLACAAYNDAIAHAVAPAAPTIDGMFEAAAAGLTAAAVYLKQAWPDLDAEINTACDALAGDLRCARADDPDLYGSEVHLGRMQGFVRVAFRLAFWELAHADSFAAATIDAVNRGGDTDTNGAIVGGLLGAFYGRHNLPKAWVDQVLNALPENPADPLSGPYHPRQFLVLES